MAGKATEARVILGGGNFRKNRDQQGGEREKDKMGKCGDLGIILSQGWRPIEANGKSTQDRAGTEDAESQPEFESRARGSRHGIQTKFFFFFVLT